MTRFTILAVALLAAAFLTVPSGAVGDPMFADGIAVGEVGPNTASFWTRAADSGKLILEVSRDPAFPKAGTIRKCVRAKSRKDRTAQVRVRRLETGVRYHYRFTHKKSGAVSDVGTFVTAPAADQAYDVSFTYSGDSDGTRIAGMPAINGFEVLARIAEESADFFIYLGDTIVADSPYGEKAETLDAYRAKYEENRGYQPLRDLLAAMSTYPIWDDHEVEDNFAGAETDRKLVKTGRKAFQEWMPLPKWSRKTGFFRTFRWGKDAEFFVLDERSFRSGNVTNDLAADPFPTLPAHLRQMAGLPDEPPEGVLEEIVDPDRTLLGKRQKELFKKRLLASDATFKFVVNEVAISEQFFHPYDRWEGYAAERTEILEFIADNQIENVVFLTTDLHGNQVLDVKLSALAGTPTIAKEIICGPIADHTIYQELTGLLGEQGALETIGFFEMLNPPLFADYDTYAYAKVEVDSAAGTATVSIKDDAGAVLYTLTLP